MQHTDQDLSNLLQSLWLHHTAQNLESLMESLNERSPREILSNIASLDIVEQKTAASRVAYPKHASDATKEWRILTRNTLRRSTAPRSRPY